MAWNTGHEGGAATLHANNARAGLTRLAMLVSMNPDSPRPIEPLIGEAVHLIVHITKTPQGRKVTEIIERIKGAENVDTIDGSALGESLGKIVGVIPIPYAILPTEQHHHGGLGQDFLEFADAHPGVFTEKPMHGVEGCSTPNFHCPVTHLVHFLGDGQEILASAAGGEKRLMTITHGQIADFNRIVHCRGWIIDKLCNH